LAMGKCTPGSVVLLCLSRYSQASTHIFFFQAEDGIRDRNVTGVQTCALPIWAAAFLSLNKPLIESKTDFSLSQIWVSGGNSQSEIGRASCREREEIAVGRVGVK